MKIYLASRFQNRELLKRVRDEWMEDGHEITSRWLDGDAGSLRETAAMDLADIKRADAFVLWLDKVQEGERPLTGCLTEFGYALAHWTKLIIVVHPELSDCIFLNIPRVLKVSSWGDALEKLDRAQTIAETLT